MSDDSVSRKRYRQAAIAYLVYGLVYLLGAFLALTPARQTDFHGVPWWVFYVLGFLVAIGFPIMIWKRFVWFTRILAVLPAYRGFVLVKRAILNEAGILNYDLFFGFVAINAAVFLIYASWRRHS